VYRALIRLFASTSARTFVLYPLCVLAFEFAWQGGRPVIAWWATPLLAWGYLQYRLAGQYRTRRGGGGPGMSVPPEQLVVDGPYRYVRNPMYLGHLIFLLGLALTFRSWLGLALFLFHVVWFHRRVRADEARLQALFGPRYADYQARVKRWIPGLF
jgi:protein-S-isoprenylcysteine O-methyltransferase Ste14